mgnify:FL=1
MKNKYLLLISEENIEYLESLNYSFDKKNIKIVEKNLSKEKIKVLAKDLNKKYNKIIFFDYSYIFYELLPLLEKKLKICWIFKYSIACFSNIDIYNYFLQIIEYKSRKLIDEIYALDFNLYTIFKSNYKFKYLMFDINQKNKKVKILNQIGIIGMDYDEISNFYNMLSACAFYRFEEVKVMNNMNSTIDFGKDFDLNIKKYESYNEILSGNKVNLYCPFSNLNTLIVLKSFDMGIPCIVSNTDMFDGWDYLKEQVVLNSDDDINEIVQKIEMVQKNKKQILKEYEKYRKNYSDKSLKTISKLIR